MACNDTRLLALSMPRRERTSTVSGSTVTSPSLPMLKLTRSPGSIPRCSRTFFGMVIWPFEVSVALGMSLPIPPFLTLFLAPLRRRGRRLRAGVQRVRGARVLAAGASAVREAQLQAVVRGIDARGALERGAVGARGVEIHGHELRGAARGAEEGDEDGQCSGRLQPAGRGGGGGIGRLKAAATQRAECAPGD